MMDIDDFKLYNDNNGHLKGDAVLVKTAKKLSEIITDDNSIIARYGGEEFIAVIVGNQQNYALEKANNILQAISDLAIKYDTKKDRTLSISIGLVSADYSHIENGNYLIRIADNNLYSAKANGKNQVIHSSIGQDNG